MKQKILVVYYSRSGSTRKVAKALARELDADLEEIMDFADRSGKEGYNLCGKEGMMRKEVVIGQTRKDPSNYELVVVGTPIWCFNFSSPVRAYLKKYRKSIKKAAFFCSCGGFPGFAFWDMAITLGKSPVAKLKVRMKQVKDGSYLANVKEFAEKIKG